MPSDTGKDRILEALEPARVAFRSAVIDAAEEVRAFTEAHRRPASEEESTARVAAELGVFAAGRIDADRFAALLGDTDVLDDSAIRLLERARAVLEELITAGDAPFQADVLPGGNLVADVETALSLLGRAFGAARVAELVRTGNSAAAGREDAASAFPFSRWTRAERAMAPPLMVEVDGADLQAGGLSAYLDGTQKIVLLVRPPAPPAALSRAITPNVFVMQTTDPATFGTMAAFDGPAIGALVPEGCATFVHDPSKAPVERLDIMSRPESPVGPLRRLSAFQQSEALQLLDMIESAGRGGGAVGGALATGSAEGATVGAADPTEGAAASGVDGTAAFQTGADAAGVADVQPADRLAAWLLSQAGLTEQVGS